MGKHKAHSLPPDTPARSPHAARLVCSWPDCDRMPLNWQILVCAKHAYEVFDYVRDITSDQEKRDREARAQLRQLEAQNRELATLKVDQEMRRNQPGWVYYLQIADKVKIGYATDVRQRMRAYPPNAVLLAVHPGTPRLERDMHRRFEGLLTDGREWFTMGEELAAHIEQAVQRFGEPDRFAHRYRSARGKQVTYPKGWSGKRPA